MCLGNNMEAMLLILLMIMGVQSLPKQVPNNVHDERNILSQMTNDLNLGAACDFPPKDVLSEPSEVPFITSCDRPAQEKPNVDYFDEGLFLCMAFYDVSLHICAAQQEGLLGDTNMLPQNATMFNTLLDYLTLRPNFTSSMFCSNLSKTLTSSEYSQTTEWVSILNKKLQNGKKCENICINADDKIQPICKILFWGNTLLKELRKTGIINSKAHHTGTPLNVNDKGMNKSRERHDEVPVDHVNAQEHDEVPVDHVNAQEHDEVPVDHVNAQETLAVGAALPVPANVDTAHKATDSATVGQSDKEIVSTTLDASQKHTDSSTAEVPTPADSADELHQQILPVMTVAPPKLPPMAHAFYTPINSAASLSKDNEQKKILDKEHKVTEESIPVLKADIKSLNEASTGTNSSNLPTENVEITDSTVVDKPEGRKLVVNHNGNEGGVNKIPDSLRIEDKSNKDSRKPVENNHKSNDVHTGTERQEEHYKAGQNVVGVTDIMSSQSPSLSSTISPNLLPEQPSSEAKLKESTMQNEGEATPVNSKGQDDTGNEAEANVGTLPIDTEIDSEEPGMTSLQDHAYDGDGTPEGGHPVDYDVETRKLPAESSRDTEAYVEDKFVDAEDSHFFAYFMAMIFLCIIGYLVFHNKQKILALAVEGRSRKNSRRRPNTSGYRKLDSNLEEAVTSPCSTSVTHVIY